MLQDFYNPTIEKLVHLLLEKLGIGQDNLPDTEISKVINKNWICANIRPAVKVDNVNLRYSRFNLSTEVIEDLNAKCGYRSTPGTVKFIIYGYLDPSTLRFIPDDFTKFFNLKSPEFEVENHFRDVLGTHEAQKTVQEAIKLAENV